MYNEHRPMTIGRAEHALPSATTFWLTAALILLSIIPPPARAIPSFARQLGVECTQCHTAYPQLNAFGRQFKLTGYLESQDQVPLYKKLSLMLEPSYTQTKTDLSDPPGDFNANDNFAVTQTSLFFGGKFAGKVGGFIQATYDGIGEDFAWDNADIRFADSTIIQDKPMFYGVDINNNPTVQDLWNTTPAWSFPFSASGIAPTPAASPLIQNLGGQVAGLGAYALWNELLYVELAGYQSLGEEALSAFGVSSDDVSLKLDNTAPYWRVALQHQWGPHYLSGGTFGMVANTFPGGDRSAGNDRFNDIGLDLQYQYDADQSDLSLRLSSIHERQELDASERLGVASNQSNNLDSFNGNINYLYDKTWGLTLGHANLHGDADLAYYGTVNGSPNSSWNTLQLDWLPYNKQGGPASWPWFNPKLSLQYINYDKFDGTSDGASDNDTLYLQAWLVF
jgi:hypothetical protein